jgi:hypothetical protein
MGLKMPKEEAVISADEIVQSYKNVNFLVTELKRYVHNNLGSKVRAKNYPDVVDSIRRLNILIGKLSEETQSVIDFSFLLKDRDSK